MNELCCCLASALPPCHSSPALFAAAEVSILCAYFIPLQVLVRLGAWAVDDTLSELGVYGVFLRQGQEVLLNAEVRSQVPHTFSISHTCHACYTVAPHTRAQVRLSKGCPVEQKRKCLK